MEKIICGDLEFEGVKYKFDFRNNMLVMLPQEMVEYTRWYFRHFEKTKKSKVVNIEATTNNGVYICFIHVKLSDIGRGALQAFVSAYVIGKVNGISPLPQCTKITKLRFQGKCIDRFYYPKNIINYNDLRKNDDLKIEIKNDNIIEEIYTINKDKYVFKSKWSIPIHSDINVALNVSSYLDIIFNEEKDINQIIEYYINIHNFFCFINNRKYINFTNITAYKNEKVRFGIQNEDDIENIEFDFDFHFLNPEEKSDLNPDYNSIRLNDLDNKFIKIFKEVSKKDFLKLQYPINTQDELYINNQKFIDISSSFESEFNKSYKDFKSSTNDEYKEVKSAILKTLANKKYKYNSELKSKSPLTNQKKAKSIIKQCNYFNKILKTIEGNLQEKINYTYKKYNYAIQEKKNSLIKNYNIDEKKAKNGILSEVFVKRRNDISHGNGTNKFNELEIISYELLRICIYCITLERCGLNEEKINIIIKKIFY